jgi:hypothetical protein
MGHNSLLTGFVIFKKDMIERDVLPCGEDYKDVKEDYPILVQALYCSTTNQSNRLSKAVKVDMYDYGTHLINNKEIDWNELYSMADEGMWTRKDVDDFKALTEEYKTSWFFDPN